MGDSHVLVGLVKQKVAENMPCVGSAEEGKEQGAASILLVVVTSDLVERLHDTLTAGEKPPTL